MLVQMSDEAILDVGHAWRDPVTGLVRIWLANGQPFLGYIGDHADAWKRLQRACAGQVVAVADKPQESDWLLAGFSAISSPRQQTKLVAAPGKLDHDPDEGKPNPFYRK